MDAAEIDVAQLKSRLLALARQEGFACAGVAPVQVQGAEALRKFLQAGWHAGMAWLARTGPGRCDARTVLASAQSVICLAAPHTPPAKLLAQPVAAYATGPDYHRLLKRRCRKLAQELQRLAPGTAARICIDTAPISDRAFAAAAGLGWIGRNGCLISRPHGSWLLLAEIVTDLPLPPDRPVSSRCGRCRRCIDACPTGAIGQNGLIDCRRCVSYLSLEHRGQIEPTLLPAMGSRLIGCDACQRACPWNDRAAVQSSTAVPAVSATGASPVVEMRADVELASPHPAGRITAADVLTWTWEQWDAITRGSAVRRPKYEMLLRNAAAAAGNARDAACRPALERLAGQGPEMAAQAARWALARLDENDRSG